MKSALSFIQIIILALCAQTVNAVGPGQSMQILQPSINVPTTKFFICDLATVLQFTVVTIK